MYQIILGNEPIFYIYYTGGDYQLIDGLTYQIGGGLAPLRVSGDYPQWAYHYLGEVTGTNDCVSNYFQVIFAFNHVPAAPEAPTFTNVTQTNLTVNWSAVDGAATYDVWRKTGTDCAGAVKITPAPVAGTTFDDSGLTCGTTYGYFITANNACGASPAGACATQATLPCYVPPLRVPYSVNPLRIDSADHGASGTVTWDAATCASPGYHLIFGKGENLATWAVDGGECAIGTGGTHPWSGIPDPSGYSSRFLWFLVVGDDGASTEASWGHMTGGGERGGITPSSVCGMTNKDLAGVCIPD